MRLQKSQNKICSGHFWSVMQVNNFTSCTYLKISNSCTLFESFRMFFRIYHSQRLLFVMKQMYLVVRTKDVELISISSFVVRTYKFLITHFVSMLPFFSITFILQQKLQINWKVREFVKYVIIRVSRFGKKRVRENPHSGIFHSVLNKEEYAYEMGKNYVRMMNNSRSIIDLVELTNSV